MCVQSPVQGLARWDWVLSRLWVCTYNSNRNKSTKVQHNLRVASAAMPAQRYNCVWIETSALVSLESVAPRCRAPEDPAHVNVAGGAADTAWTALALLQNVAPCHLRARARMPYVVWSYRAVKVESWDSVMRSFDILHNFAGVKLCHILLKL